MKIPNPFRASRYRKAIVRRHQRQVETVRRMLMARYVNTPSYRESRIAIEEYWLFTARNG